MLIPRPETEGLVDLVLEEMRRGVAAGEAPPVVTDVGTGSGAIAVALALESPARRIVATDASSAALEVARANLAEHGIGSRVELVRGHLLAPLAPGRFDVVVSNPPYVATGDWERLESSVRDFEPREALDGGPDGLAIIRGWCSRRGPPCGRGAWWRWKWTRRGRGVSPSWWRPRGSPPLPSLRTSADARATCGRGDRSMEAIDTRADELGRLVGQSEEYVAWRRAEERLTADDGLRQSLDHLAQLQVAAADKAERGEPPTPEQQAELDALWSQVQVSLLVPELHRGARRFDKITHRINETILNGMKKGSNSSIITLG